MSRGIAVDAYTFQATVALPISAAEAGASIHPATGTIEEVDDSTRRLTIGADDVQWVARFLVNLPFGFEVEQPNELKAELAAIGSRLVAEFG